MKKEKEGFRRGRGDGGKKVKPVKKSFIDSKIYCAPRRIQLFIAPHRRNVLLLLKHLSRQTCQRRSATRSDALRGGCIRKRIITSTTCANIQLSRDTFFLFFRDESDDRKYVCASQAREAIVVGTIANLT